MQKGSDLKLYLRLLSHVRPYAFPFFISICGYILYATANPMFAKLIGIAVDAIQQVKDDPDSFNRFYLPAAVVAVFALRGLGTFLGKYFIAVVSRGVIFDLRNKMFNSLLNLPCHFYDKAGGSHLLSRIIYNVEQLTAASTTSVTVVIREGFTVIFLVGSLFWMSWELTLTFLAVVPIIAWVVNAAGKFFRRYSRRIQASMGDITHVANEGINGFKEIKIFNAQEKEYTRFQSAAAYNKIQLLKLALAESTSVPIIQLLVSFSLALLFWIALSPNYTDAFATAGEFVEFITLASLVAKPLRELTSVQSQIQKGLAGAESVFELIDEENEPNTGTERKAEIKGDIVFENVHFAYNENGDVLKNINLTVKAGETIAFVGQSGSGKTTLVNLLTRFYEPTSGRITLDGTVLQEFELSNLRDHISYVGQHVMLFNDTVRNNIVYGGGNNTSEDALKTAIEKANATSFIDELPHQLETSIGDNGFTLSGGQRQRLAIARAFYKDAPILILDEATSALDNESEKFIQTALDNIMQNRTTFVIAHRLSTVQNADKIVVLRNGSIIEVGKHDELLATDGYYKMLYDKQFA